MSDPKLRNSCFNRDVVNVERRLFSPKYDDKGVPGHEIFKNFEFNDRTTMCFYGNCGKESYNAWVEATDAYINGTGDYKLYGHYKFINKRLASKYGGAVIPQHLRDKMDEVKTTIDEWNDAGYKPDKTWKDELQHPFTWYWEGEIKSIIEYFDNAACAYDKLNLIAIAIDEASAAKPAPSPSLEDVPDSGVFGGGSGTKEPTRSNTGLIVGVTIAAVAGYLGYKVLTE